MVAVRPARSSHWRVYPLLGSGSSLDAAFAEHLRRLVRHSEQPLFLRDYVVEWQPELRLQHLRRQDKAVLPWGPVQYLSTESLYVRSGYEATGKSWLLQSKTATDPWTKRLSASGPCEPLAAPQEGKHFSEAAAEPIRAGRWVAIVREDASDKRARPLYQTESVDGGCTWSTPIHIGDGTQPNLLRVDVSNDDKRLILCVGDRTRAGLTRELGIQCRLSSNLAVAPAKQPLQWGEPRMIYVSSHSADLGQPQSLHLGAGLLETYFYADRGRGTATDILYVRHYLKDLPAPSE